MTQVARQCDDLQLHDVPARRARLRLFSREFTPATSTTPARTRVEGQLEYPRTVEVHYTYDEGAGKCELLPAVRYVRVTDLYDVFGEASWDTSTVFANVNVIDLTALLVSDPGSPGYYTPTLTGNGRLVLIGGGAAQDVERSGGRALPSAQQVTQCIAAAGWPSIAMSLSGAAEGEVPGGCPIFGGFDYHTNCWKRVEGALPEALGTIEGRAVSLVPTHTETPNEVQHATVVLYEQRGGSVREQLGSETDGEYEAYLKERGRKEVARIQIERRSDGTYTFDEPGRFVLDRVPLFRFLEDLTVGRWGTIWYTVEVTAAETDEEVPVEGGGTETNRVLFKAARAINVRPEEPPITVGLQPSDIALKRDLIANLSEICELNYAPPEAGATAFLDEIDAGQRELTEETDEGIRRGIWAERAAYGAVTLADELVETALTGLGTLLADLWADFTDFHRADISRKLAGRRKLEKPPDANVSQSFNVEPLNAKVQQSLSGTGDTQLLAQIDVVGAVKKLIKSIKPGLVYVLEEAGRDDAADIADLVVRAFEVLADSFETRTLAGGLKSLVKQAVSEGVALGRPLLLDGGGVSYCALTDQELQTSVAQMTAWQFRDEDVYARDRREVVAIITEMNDRSSDVLAHTRAAQEVAKGLDAVKNAAAFIGTVAKWVKVVEKLANLTKYALNAESFLRPMLQVYGFLPEYVADAVTAAYAREAFLARPFDGSAPAALAATIVVGDTGAAHSHALVLPAIDDASLRGVLDAVAAALSEDRIGDAIASTVDTDEASSYVAQRAAYERTVSGLLLQASGASAAGLRETLARAVDTWSGLQIAQARLAEHLQQLLIAVYAGEYASPASSGYGTARDKTLVLIEATKRRLAAATYDLNTLHAALAGAVSTPAVLVETLPPVSSVTGESLVSASPETFTLRARVMNLSDVAIDALSAIVTVFSPNDSLSIVGASERSVATGALAPYDGADGSGTDETVVEWQITYTGDFSFELMILGVDLLESGVQPLGFVTAGSRQVLTIGAQVADADLDGLPDDFEARNGLDLERDDSADDLDADALSNLVELRLGTEPDLADSDADGLDDGEEMRAGEDGFVTDPVLPDTDGDGEPDGVDGDPNDAGSIEPPPPAEEPAVELSSDLVLLTREQPQVAVTVTNGGSGTLIWSAQPAEPELLAISPDPRTVRGEDELLFVTVPEAFDFDAFDVLVTTVDVVDASGIDKDSRSLRVIFGGGAQSALCGHPADGSIGGAPTASDALFALRASVGSVGCALCRCDVDASQSITATDALRILRAAVGIAADLNCPAC